MSIKGIILILLVALMVALVFHKQIYRMIEKYKKLFTNKEEK